MKIYPQQIQALSLNDDDDAYSHNDKHISDAFVKLIFSSSSRRLDRLENGGIIEKPNLKNRMCRERKREIFGVFVKIH